MPVYEALGPVIRSAAAKDLRGNAVKLRRNQDRGMTSRPFHMPSFSTSQPNRAVSRPDSQNRYAGKMDDRGACS